MTSSDKAEPTWIEVEVALAIHDRQLAEHGGLSGLRDAGGLASALERPRNKWSYGETDASELAAAYAYGLARNHPFADGNKRTAWVLARLFLVLNGQTLQFAPEDAVHTVMALADGTLSEEALADWFRAHLTKA